VSGTCLPSEARVPVGNVRARLVVPTKRVSWCLMFIKRTTHDVPVLGCQTILSRFSVLTIILVVQTIRPVVILPSLVGMLSGHNNW
jgi:hypothetical protein